jgi:rhamnogalacturonan II specific xylosyltransferase
MRKMIKDVGGSSSSSNGGAAAAAARKFGCLYRCFFLVLALTFVAYNINHNIRWETATSLSSETGSSGFLLITDNAVASATTSAQDQRQASIQQSSPSIRLSSPNVVVSVETESATSPAKPVHRARESFPDDAEMGWDQVESILSVLPEDGNLLVWGLGRESVFWNQVTTARVIFLEDNGNVDLVNGQQQQQRQLDVITKANPQLEAYAIDYTTTNTKESYDLYMQNPESWPSKLKLDDDATFPAIVWQIQWHVILVDAPLGYNNMGPERYQSLYMSQLLARNSQSLSSSSTLDLVHVFVDDYERRVERDFAQKVLNRAPLEVMARPERNSVSPANEQAHFVWDNDSAGNVTALLSAKFSWIVLVEVSDGYYDFFLNWLSFYEKLDISRTLELVVIAEDDVVQQKIERDIVPHKPKINIRLQRGGLSINTNALDFSTQEYRALVSARPTHIKQQLEDGYNVIYADIDAVWRSDPLPFLVPVLYRKDAMLQVEYDSCYWNQKIKPCYCTGFIALQSNERTIQLMQDWREALAAKPKLNQPAFNDVLFQTQKKTGIRHAPLPRWAFPNGNDYYEVFDDAQRAKAVVIHNNFMVGHDKKRNHFITEGLWNVAATALKRRR